MGLFEDFTKGSRANLTAENYEMLFIKDLKPPTGGWETFELLATIQSKTL